MDVEVLKSYLVSLGFAVDQPQLRKFELALKDAAKAVDSSMNGIAGVVLKAQGAITGAFVAIGTAVVGIADHVAMADQGYRLFGLRMFLTTEQARKLKVGMDSLGASLEEIAWDPELRQRFLELSDLQDALARDLGPDFEKNLRGVRDLRFEFTKLRVELQYLSMRFVSSLFKAFGTDIDGVLAKLKEWEAWFVQHMPQIGDWLAKNFVPVLKETWNILKLTGTALGELAVLFTNFVGLAANDDSIQGTQFSFEKLAGAIEHVVGWLDAVIRSITNAERLLVHFADAAVLAMSGKFADAKKELQAGLSELSPGSGAVLGGVAGAGVGSLYLAGVGASIGSALGPFGTILGAGAGGTIGLMLGGGAGAGIGAGIGAINSSSGDIASQARAAAILIGSKLGIDPRLIFEQFQHETGNFTHIASQNNLAGIRMPGRLDYRKFDSITGDFADYYANLLSSKRYASQGILKAKTEEDFAAALKRGGYYEDSYDNYVNGMKRFARQDAASSFLPQGQTVTIGEINIPITQPNASPEAIHRAVSAGVADALGRQTQRTLPQLAYVG